MMKTWLKILAKVGTILLNTMVEHDDDDRGQ
jgi:hypothetical protein